MIPKQAFELANIWVESVGGKVVEQYPESFIFIFMYKGIKFKIDCDYDGTMDIGMTRGPIVEHWADFDIPICDIDLCDPDFDPKRFLSVFLKWMEHETS